MKKYVGKFLIRLMMMMVMLIQLLPALSQSKEEFESLDFIVPAGFSVNKTATSVVLTDPSVSAGENYSITINRSTLSLRKIEKTFPLFWKESLVMDGFDNPSQEPQFVKFTTNNGWECYRGGKNVSYSSQSAPQFYHLTVIKYLGVTLRIVTRASTQDLFEKKIPMLMQVVGSIEFKKQPATPNSNTTGHTNIPSGTNSGSSSSAGTGTDPSNTSVPVRNYILYMSVQGDLMSNAEISVLYFSPDGTVYTDMPEKGFAQFNLPAQKAETPGSFGTYRSGDHNILVTMNGAQSEAAYNIRPDGTLQSSQNPAMVFQKIDPLENYRLEGIFVNNRDNTAKISFTKDGKFTEEGLMKSIAPNSAGNNGSGKYAISQNSIYFQYDDGHSVQLNIYVMPEDYQTGSPSKILINNYVLVRS
ncbi:MAG: lipocalin family protein [Flavisolibacter sp.]